MNHPKFFSTLLLSCFLLLFFTHGLRVEMMETLGHGSYVRSSSPKEISGKSRKMMIEIMDYADPGPNTNTRSSGYLNPPPPPSAA